MSFYLFGYERATFVIAALTLSPSKVADVLFSPDPSLVSPSAKGDGPLLVPLTHE